MVRRAFVFLAAVLIACGPPAASSCASATPVARKAAFFDVADATGSAVPASKFVSELPATFLVMSAADVDRGMKERDRLAAARPTAKFTTVVDARGLDPIQVTSLADKLVEASLDEMRPVLIDRIGDLSRSLRDASAAVVLVRVEPDQSVSASTPLPSAPQQEAAAFGEAKS